MALYRLTVNKTKFLMLLNHFGIVTEYSSCNLVFKKHLNGFSLSDFACDYKLYVGQGLVKFIVAATNDDAKDLLPYGLDGVTLLSEELLLKFNLIKLAN